MSSLSSSSQSSNEFWNSVDLLYKQREELINVSWSAFTSSSSGLNQPLPASMKYPEQGFPHIMSKQSFGIAMSGGGTRAASLGVGWLQALSDSNLLAKARYMSVNSGGSWVTEPVFWKAGMQLEKSYGNNQEPSLEDLDNKFNESISKALGLNAKKDANKTMKHVLSGDFATEVLKNCGWSEAVDDMFFKICAPARHIPYAAVQDRSKVTFRIPFLIVNGATVDDEVQQATGDKKTVFTPFEFTPTYCGIPIDPSVLFTPSNNHADDDDVVHPSGFVHRSLFDCVAPKCVSSNNKRSKSSEEATTTHNDSSSSSGTASGVSTTSFQGKGMFEGKYPHARVIDGLKTQKNGGFPLSKISGISSSALVEGFYESFGGKPLLDKLVNASLSPQAQFWVPSSSDEEEVIGGEKTFSDGGSCDNSAILALLRRGTEHVIALAAADDDINDVEGFATKHVCDYAALFGMPTHVGTQDNYTRNRTVFKPDRFEELLGKFREQRKACVPLIHRMTLEIMDNKYCGVYAQDFKNGTVDILFVFNAKAETWTGLGVDWKELSPPPFVEKKAEEKVGYAVDPFRPKDLDADFPYINVGHLHYTPKLVEKMAQLSEWSLQSSDEFQQFKNDILAAETSSASSSLSSETSAANNSAF
jgi:hypothetical protein